MSKKTSGETIRIREELKKFFERNKSPLTSREIQKQIGKNLFRDSSDVSRYCDYTQKLGSEDKVIRLNKNKPFFYCLEKYVTPEIWAEFPTDENDNAGLEELNAGLEELIESQNNGTTLELQPYQENIIRDLGEMGKHPKAIINLPTGAGKTLTAAKWLAQEILLKENSGKVLWLAHRLELLYQAHNTFVKLGKAGHLEKDLKCGSLCGRQKSEKFNDKDIIFATPITCRNNLEQLGDWIKKSNEKFVLVIDEAHHAIANTYNKVLKYVKDKSNDKFALLGLSATPTRTDDDEKNELLKMFNPKLLDGDVNVEELIEQKVLSKPNLIKKDMSTGKKGDIKEFNNWSCDFRDFDQWPSANELANDQERKDKIAEFIVNENKKTLVFAINIDDAEKLCEKIVNNVTNRVCVCVTSESSKDDRQKNIEKFRESKDGVLVNVQIMTEGMDIPDVECVVLARPTISEILMSQMIGRGMRGEKFGGTENVDIVDFLGIWKKSSKDDEKTRLVNPEFILEKYQETNSGKGRETEDENGGNAFGKISDTKNKSGKSGSVPYNSGNNEEESKNANEKLEKCEYEELLIEAEKENEWHYKQTIEVWKRNHKIKDYVEGVLKENGCLKCQVCGIDGIKHYGELDKELQEKIFELHHVFPLSESAPQQNDSDLLKNYVILCPNCHTLVHKDGIKSYNGENKLLKALKALANKDPNWEKELEE